MLHTQHTGLCKPSEAQFEIMRMKRGIPVAPEVFETLCTIIATMKPSTAQIRGWIKANAVGMRTDAKGIGNLKSRIQLYQVWMYKCILQLILF